MNEAGQVGEKAAADDRIGVAFLTVGQVA